MWAVVVMSVKWCDLIHTRSRCQRKLSHALGFNGVIMLTCETIQLTVELYRSGLGGLPAIHEIVFYLSQCQALA